MRCCLSRVNLLLNIVSGFFVFLLLLRVKVIF